ncbi:MAG: ribose-phosphate pyrophosphokinase [Acidobacteria bacterium]|nr:ribose-phosphate pyrophosphokinase [Acidobacteriota bacterium]
MVGETAGNELKIFSGSAHPGLAREIAEPLGLPLGRIQVSRFPDGECYCQILENVRGADVFLIQPTCPPVNENLIELLLILDATKRSSASRVTAVLPYYGYARQDRKDKPRVPISAKVVADLLTAAGADRILTMDLHAAPIQGFFDIPVDHLFATPVVLEYLEGLDLKDLVIVSPDAGGVERARAYGKRLGAGIAIVDKRRGEGGQPEVMHLVGEVRGRTALIVDDIIDTGGTLAGTVRVVRENGAQRVLACFTHAVLSGPAWERIRTMEVDELIVTNTIPLPEEKRRQGEVRVLSVGPLLGEAIRRIHVNSSVSSLFV